MIHKIDKMLETLILNDDFSHLSNNDKKNIKKISNIDLKKDLDYMKSNILDSIGRFLDTEHPFFAGRMFRLLKILIIVDNINNLIELKKLLLNFENNQNEHIKLFKKIDNFIIKQEHIDEYFNEFYLSFNNIYTLNNLDNFIYHSQFDDTIIYSNFAKQLLLILIKDYNIKNKIEMIFLLENSYYYLNSLDILNFKELTKDLLFSKKEVIKLAYRYII